MVLLFSFFIVVTSEFLFDIIGISLIYSSLWLCRRYCHSEMKRKVYFPFAFHSFIRNFAIE